MAKKTDAFFDFDMTKFLADMRVPGMPAGAAVPGLDLNAVADYQKRNIEAVSTANKLAFESLQAMMRRQGELARQMMDDMNAAASRLSSVQDVRGRLECQVELVREALERASAVSREMTDMAANANADVAGVLNDRLMSAFDELRDVLHALPEVNPILGDAALRAQVATSAADAEKKPAAAKPAAAKPAAAKPAASPAAQAAQ